MKMQTNLRKNKIPGALNQCSSSKSEELKFNQPCFPETKK